MHSKLISLLRILGAVFLVSTSAHADSGAWRVMEMSGTVRTQQPMAGMQLISTGEALGAGAVLATGHDGRAVLSRGEQQIVVGPNSRMSLPAAEDAKMTRIFQDLGTLLFKVDKQEKQHFRVETPVIAAVVKGTTFTVTVGANGHAVHVAEGAVEVSSLSGQTHELVTAGLTAHVSHKNPSVIQLSKARRGESKSAVTGRTFDRDDADNDRSQGATKQDGRLIVPAKVGDKPLDFTNLTDGLVQPSGKAAHAATVVRFGGDASPGQHPSRADSVASLRQSATNNNNASHAAEVRNVGQLNRNDGPTNNNGIGPGNANGPETANGNGKGPGNGPGSENGNGNGNAGNNASNGAISKEKRNANADRK